MDGLLCAPCWGSCVIYQTATQTVIASRRSAGLKLPMPGWAGFVWFYSARSRFVLCVTDDGRAGPIAKTDGRMGVLGWRKGAGRWVCLLNPIPRLWFKLQLALTHTSVWSGDG